MLDLMRKNVQSFLVKGIITLVIFAFIGTIFLVWGVGDDHREQKGRIVATVFGEEVPYLEYHTEYRQLYEHYRNRFRDNWSEDMAEKLNLKKTALDNIINRRVFIHEAAKQGIMVTDEEVMGKIKYMSMFNQNGRFEPQMYVKILKHYMHMDAPTFESQIKRGMIIDRMQKRIRTGIKVSRKELLDKFVQKNEKMQADYVLFSPKEYLSKVTVSDEETAKFFGEHQTDYELPEQRKIQYIYVNSLDFKGSLTVDDESIEKYYTTHINQYQIPKQVKARHILIKANAEDEKEEQEKAKKTAEDLLKKIKEEGADFAELAKEFSDDPGSASKGGELDFFEKGRMTPNFEKVAFSLEKGEISDLVETPFGYHIIEVQDIKEAATKALEEVKPQIKDVLLDEKAWEVAENEGYNLVRKFYKTGEFETLATAADYQLGQTEFSQESKFVPNIGRSEEIVTAAFILEEDAASTPIRANTGYYILRLIEEVPPKIPELEKVRDKVMKNLKKEKAKKEMERLAEEFYQKLQADKVDFTKLAGEYNVTVKDTDEVSRNGYIKGLGSVPEFSQALFRLKKGEISAPIPCSRGYCIALLKTHIPVDLAKFEEERESLHISTLQRKEQQFLQLWVERLKEENNIIVDYNNV